MDRRRALLDLRAIEEHGSHAYVAFFTEQIRDARNAFNRGDRKWAHKTWREMNETHPKLILTSEVALNLLVDIGEYDEAEALIQKGRRRYPWRRAMFAAVFAYVAYSRGDFDETLRRCAILRRKFPRVTEGYTIAASCLGNLGRQNESEAMITQAAARFPHNLDIVVAYARHAVHRKEWQEALRRWGMVNDRFDNFLGPVGMAQSLRELGRFAEATEFARMAYERSPKFPWGYSELADIAAAEGDLEKLSRCWEFARERCPDFARAYTAGAETERLLGREMEADKILSIGVVRLRFALGLHLEYARSADRRGDRAASAARWALVRERFPDCDEAKDAGVHEAEEQKRTD